MTRLAQLLKTSLVLFTFGAPILPWLTNPLLAADEDIARATQRLGIEHLLQLGTVSEPFISPEGEWVAYTVSRDDLEKDEEISRVWMVPIEGGNAEPMTTAEHSSSHPRWSPDGRFLAFLSARDDKPAQVWLLPRHGGEAIQLTQMIQDVETFAWSPDSQHLLLELQDASEQQIEAHEQGKFYEEKTPPPWVIDRQQFKADYVGYLDRRRTHIYRFDVTDKSLHQLTFGDFDDSEASWSPDGTRIAFTSNRSDNPDANYNTDIWVVSAAAEEAPAKPIRVTENPGPDLQPAWSPDGKLIAHQAGTDTAAMLYATAHLAVSAAQGGQTRVLTEDLDRMIFQPSFSRDGRHLWFLLEDSGEQNLARIRPDGGKIDRVVTGQDVVLAYHEGNDGQLAALVSRPHLPEEVFLLKKPNRAKATLKQLSDTNGSWLSTLELGQVEKHRYLSEDGTEIEGFVIKPAGFEPGKRYPTILDIHGGPQSQYDYSFHFEAQLYAANGYLVVHPNPRGSTGYGQAFCLAIWQDWGGPDFDDVMAAVDHVIEQGWADPDRLGVGGWSYGGILTNHVITKTDRFEAAITGASEVLYVVNYGHDIYQRWWEQELGLPWEPESRKKWERISPFNQVEKIKTPTLILGGEEDWNVPIINSEQLYMALKRLGVETQLVVYPGQYHGIDKPSYARDLYQRYLAWFGKYLQSGRNDEAP